LLPCIEPDDIEPDELDDPDVPFIELPCIDDDEDFEPALWIERIASTRHMYSPAPFPKCELERM
jgi:hypothetical protein